MTDPRREHKADWLVLAYLAGDNDLEQALLGDLNEMERAGSRPGSVEILAQVDRAAGFDASNSNWRTTRRYHVTCDADPRRIGSRLLADLGETNTGDPQVLEDFITFGARALPARACALILVNHGSGFYVPPEMLSKMRTAATEVRVRSGFFHTTRRRLDALQPERRGIAYDDASADCLDNRELKAVLRHAHRIFGHKVDLIGMDACLMTMLEVAYQLRDHARILVGSEELEPGAGWPHDRILADLTSRPAMTREELAATIVRRYAEAYERTGEDATQAAIDLGKLGDLVGAVDALARALLARLPDSGLEATLHAAWRRSLRFFAGAYVDLRHFAGNLAAAAGDQSAVRRACLGIQHAIEGRGAGGPIVAERHVGRRMGPARGLSIYFPPFRDPSVFYRELDFARATRWADFLDAYLGRGRAGDAR